MRFAGFVLVYPGAIVLLAGLLAQACMVGCAIILCIGVRRRIAMLHG